MPNTRQNLTEYLLRTFLLVLFLTAEWVATSILQTSRPFFNYHITATTLSFVFAVLVPFMGNRSTVRDFADLCWYDVAIQIYGFISAWLEHSLALYATLSLGIYYIKLTRIFWFAKAPNGGLVDWPTIGLMGHLSKSERALKSSTKQITHIILAIVVVLMLAEIHRRNLFQADKIVFCFIFFLTIKYTRPLIAHLEAQQAELIANAEALATAREREKWAAEVAAKNQELGQVNWQLAQANQDLAQANQKLGELNQELHEANDDLEIAWYQVDAANADLKKEGKKMAHANHDIIPYLGHLHQWAEMLLAECTTDKQRELTAEIIKFNATIGSRMEQILGIQRISEHKKLSLHSSVWLDDVLGRIEKPFALMAEKKGSTFKVTGNFDVHVWSHAEYLERIISNLVKNAIVHNPAGTRIRALVTTRWRLCLIRIFDTGSGIPEALGEEPVTNFTDFITRVANTARDPDADTANGNHGIGLQSVVTLCNDLNIKPRLYSRLGLRSIFEIHMELAAPAPRQWRL